MTRYRSRGSVTSIHRALKWAGLAICMVTLGVWVISAWRFMGYRGNGYSFYFFNGRLGISKYVGDPDEIRKLARECLLDGRGRLTWRFAGRSWRYLWYAELSRIYTTGSLEPSVGYKIVHHTIRLPMWLLAALVAIPTGLLWHRVRRVLFDHCQQCGYNLTGNTSGICPECGTPIPKDYKEPAPASDPSKE